jgi:hypothetical protein
MKSSVYESARSSDEAMQERREGKTYLDALVVQLQAELDPLSKRLPRLSSLVHIPTLSPDHPPLLVIHPNAADDSVPDRFRDDVLCVLLVVELELEADVFEGDLGVGEGDGVDACLDNGVAETEDEGLGSVGREGGRVSVEGLGEEGEVTDSDGCSRSKEKEEGGWTH